MLLKWRRPGEKHLNIVIVGGIPFAGGDLTLNSLLLF